MNCKIFLALIALATPLHATVWEYAPLVVDEVVIDTDTLVRAPRFEKIEHEQLSTFKDFRYPHNNAIGEITFIANDFRKFHYEPNDMHGIYRSYADGRLIPIALRGMPVPELDGHVFELFKGLHSHGSTLVFSATTQKAKEVLMCFHDGHLHSIAYSGKKTSLGTISEIWFGMPHEKQLIFTAALCNDSASASEKNCAWGAYIYDFEGKFIFPLMTESTPIPGREEGYITTWFYPTLTLKNGVAYIRNMFRTVNQVADGRPVFYRYQQGLYKAISSREDGRFLSGEFRLEKIFDTLDNNSLTRRAQKFLSNTTPEEWEKVRNSRIFHSVHTYTIAASDTVWAAMSVTADSASHILVNTKRGFQIVVDSDTAIPDLFEGTLDKFGKYLQVYDDIVYFQAGNDNFRGLFAYDTTLDRLYLVLDMDEKIDDKSIEFAEMGFTSVYKNKMAMAVKFQDGSAGVYLATLPERYFLKK